MNYEQAISAYFNAVEQTHGRPVSVAQPRESMCEVDKSGRWLLRNTHDFLAYVTSTGQVLNSRFQRIGGSSEDSKQLDDEKLLAANDTLGQVAECLGNNKESETAAMALQVEMVRLFLVELAAYLINGDDLNDALLKAAKGEMKV